MIDESSLRAALRRQDNKWQSICSHIEKLPENPMALITEVFYGGDLFLAERLKQEGDNMLLEAQQYWMQYLLPALEIYFAQDEMELKYDASLEMSPIYIFHEEHAVACFSPYWRFFEEYGIPGKEELMNKRTRLVQKAISYEEELEAMYAVSENPSLLAEENTWDYAKALFNPKKHRKKIGEEADELREKLQRIEVKVRRIENQMEQMEKDFLQTSYYLDKIKSRVSKWGDFTFHTPEEEEVV